jgi:pSer/pThr/pTyr-binding forkhead associated (FHA) protein
MSNAPIGEAVLEVIASDGSHRSVRVTELPFCIGRGVGNGNQLQLPDACISRRAAAILFETNHYLVEDRGQRGGIFINGKKSRRAH